MLKKNLFREKALQHTGSVEKTDELIKIITPPGWLALSGFALIILIALAWSVLGSVSTTVSGQGIILKKGGIFNIVANGSGQITKILVNKNSYVKKRQVIAIIDQPELSEKISIAKMQLESQKKELVKAKQEAEKRIKVRKKYLLNQKGIELSNVANNREKVKYLNGQLANQKELLDKGLITNEQYENTKQQLNDVMVKIDQSNNQIIQYDYDLLELENQTDNILSKSENQIKESENNLRILQSQFDIASKVVSSFEGRILEIKVYVGSTVSQGVAVASIESNQTEMQAVIYLSPYDGKKVRKSMAAQIVPSTVKKEEYGYMIGNVSEVSKFPISTSAMKATIDNEGLVSLFTKEGPPITISVNFEEDTSNGKIKWSSARGEENEITPGTLCRAEITISKQKPITLVFPYIKQLFD